MKWYRLLLVAAILAFSAASLVAQTFNEVGGLEGSTPAYWNIGNTGGATLTWAWDQTAPLGRSLEIVKTTTGDSASWISSNMCDIWSPSNPANIDILVGAYYKTSGVNVNPTADSAKWWISYSFYDSAGTFIGETKLPIDQSVATQTGSWLADTNQPGQTSLPRKSTKTIVKFVAGKAATGTVWATNFVFYGRGGQWAGQDWNTGLLVPQGWYYWLPPNGGNDGLLSNGFENTRISNTVSHSGSNSLMFDMPFNRAQHDGYVGTQRFPLNQISSGVNPGDAIRISVWVKADSLVPDSAAAAPGAWAVGITPLFFTGAGNNYGYGPVGPQIDYTFAFPAVTSFDWTQYSIDITVPTGVSAADMEARLHVYNRFVGRVYFDDLTIEKLDVAGINEVGGLEGTTPAYWNIGNMGGATLSWAWDQTAPLGRSLEIAKTSTGDSASWISSNMCDIWSPSNPANIDILVGAYYKTSGVNVNPTADSAKWWISYSFYDSAGTFIGETKLPIDQSVATQTGSWIADTNQPGQTSLPRKSTKTIVKFVAGKAATGTVWATNFVFYGRGGQWAGQDWNTGLLVPQGWYYWLPPNGGNDGLLSNGFENTRISNTVSHSGSNSLMFDMPGSRAQHDGYVGTQRFYFNQNNTGSVASPIKIKLPSALDSVSAGDVLRISVWVKADSLVPDSAAAAPGAWAVGLTPLFFSGLGNNYGYGPVGPQVDYTFAFPAVTSFDWTQYSIDVTVPSGVGAVAMETRLHVYNRFVGRVYFDDLTIEKLAIPQISSIGGFEGATPAYWNIANTGGATLSWATDQTAPLGRTLEIAKTTTGDSASWISSNMCDIWSPSNPANIDIFVGAYYKTSGVNVNPTADSAKWWISYSFYDSAGTFIGETKLPIDQSVATQTGSWIADTNRPGQTSLPRKSTKTIVKFVAGKAATGTVWATNFVFYGRGGQWAGQDWNTGLLVPQGWYYWLPPNGGNDGLVGNGFENTRVTTAQAHSGSSSLMFDMPFARQQHDGFVGTQRFMLDGSGPNPSVILPGKTGSKRIQAKAGDVLRISVWVMADSLVPDSAVLAPGAWAVGFTPLFFDGTGNNYGYNPVGPQVDYTFAFPTGVTSFGWTQYSLDVTVPTGVNAVAMEVRLHVYNRFVGRVYFDDLDIEQIGSTLSVGNGKSNLPKTYALDNNYPNPFNPTTTIQYAVPRTGFVSLGVYNILGQRVRTLINSVVPAGYHNIVWDSKDQNGMTVESGVYFYRLEVGNMALVKKMLLIK